MRIKKLLIVDSSEDFTELVADEMKTKFFVKTSNDGQLGLDLLLSWKPDTVVCGITTKNLDGLSMLQCAAEKGLSPAVILIIRNGSDYIYDKATQMNIAYIMKKPCNMKVLSNRICDVSRPLRPAPPPPSPLIPAVTEILEELGIENHRDGFCQMQIGIPLLVENRQLRFSKELYPAIGKHLGIDHSGMEKTIRDAIQAAWKNRNEAIWRKYFPLDLDGGVIHQTNKSLMLTLADYIYSKILSNEE